MRKDVERWGGKIEYPLCNNIFFYHLCESEGMISNE
jgi:hypothetical protein